MCTKAQLTQIIKEVSDGVQNMLGDKLHNIILYGSYARGDHDDESDIDIIVLADIPNYELSAIKKSVDKISSVVSLKNDLTVCISVKNKDFFDKHKKISPFYQNIVTEGVDIYGLS